MSDTTGALHRFARAGRTAALAAVSPLDRAILRLNGKRDFPPVHLRRQNGPLHGFERVAGEYVGMFAALGLISPTSKIVDAGCGSAALWLALRERLSSEGHYVGFDVHEPVVEWASGAFEDDERATFHHYDYFSSGFNPTGQRGLAWPVADGYADLVVLKSVFTHLLPDDARYFVSEIARTLSNGGAAFVTAFTYEDDAPPEKFPYAGEGFRYLREGAPEAGIALPHEWLMSLFRDASLKVDFRFGFWRGHHAEQFAYQDVLLIRRR